MIILDHGNMCRHHFHDITTHSFPDIEEISFFDNGGPHLHTHNIIKKNVIMCRHNFGDDIMHSCQDIEENTAVGVSVMAAPICIFTQLPKLNFIRDPMGL